jgi:hypothetical protein
VPAKKNPNPQTIDSASQRQHFPQPPPQKSPSPMCVVDTPIYNNPSNTDSKTANRFFGNNAALETDLYQFRMKG